MVHISFDSIGGTSLQSRRGQFVCRSCCCGQTGSINAGEPNAPLEAEHGAHRKASFA